MEEPSQSRNRVSLEDFAKKTPAKVNGLPCWACHIKETAEINEARRNGVQMPVIQRWLVEECGYSEEVAGLWKLKNHFSTRRHHERR